MRCFRTLARIVSPAGDDPPTEFLLFSAGVNESSKGPVLFDAAAAAAVMAAFAQCGTDLMIDLEHQALLCPEARADSADARGWARLELRDDGSLWAVDVKWTPDGARRLLEKTQRYTSPAFYQDADGRVIELVNVAIVAMPATYDAAPLVAASRGVKVARNTPAATMLGTSMDPEQIKASIDAITDGSLAKALGLDASASPQDVLDAVQAAVNALGPDAGPADSSPDNATPPDPSAESPDAPVAAAMRRLLGRETNSEALDTLEKMVERVKAIDDEEAKLSGAQRAELVGELVKLGAETPATAWADVDKKIPAARFLSETVADIRTRVTTLRAARPKVKTEITPPRDKTGGGIETLSKKELDECKRVGRDPADYLERKQKMARRG